jgi:hypothetical protein
MQLLNLVSGLPVYLPYDKAPVPFGDPFNDVTITSASPGSVKVPGYQPTVNDAIAFTTNSGGTMTSGLANGVTYYVAAVTTATGAFTVASTKGGTAIITSGQAGNTAAGQITAHLLSNQVDGTVQPFKPNNSVVVMNITGTNATLLSGPDTNGSLPGAYVQAPAGATVWSTIATVNSGTAQLVTLNNDWILASSSGLVLLQN